MLKYINHVGGGYRMSGFANAYAYQLLWMKFGLNIWFELASSEAFSYHTVWCHLPCVPYVSWMYIKSYMCNCSVQLRLTRRQIALIWYGCFDDWFFSVCNFSDIMTVGTLTLPCYASFISSHLAFMPESDMMILFTSTSK